MQSSFQEEHSNSWTRRIQGNERLQTFTIAPRIEEEGVLDGEEIYVQKREISYTDGKEDC